MTRVVGYWRPFSRDDADVPEAVLKAAGAMRIVVEASADARISPALQRTLSTLKAGDILVVERATHVAPSLGRFIGIVADLAERGINFRSLREPALCIGCAPPAESTEVFAALEALRREFISMRTRAGLAKAAHDGRKPGRPTVMTDERLAIARELLTQGRPVTHVARVIGVSPGAVRRAIPTGNAGRR